MFTDTLDAYINKYSSLVSYLADNATAGAVPPSDPAPPDLTSRAISLRVRLAFGFLKQNTTDTSDCFVV
jgi:neutral ceramidase